MAAQQKTASHLDPKYDHYDYPSVSPVQIPGFPGHTTPDQDAKVYQLRVELERLGYTERLDTLTLLRFLRARKFDVQAAKHMLVAYSSFCFIFGFFLFFFFFFFSLKQTINQQRIQQRKRANMYLPSGSSKAKNGERSLEPTTLLVPLNTLKNQRSLNTTPSTIIRRTRYAGIHYSLILIHSFIAFANYYWNLGLGWETCLH